MTDSTPEAPLQASSASPAAAIERAPETSQDLRLALMALLGLAVLVVHGASLFGDFVYDDLRLIVSNPRLSTWSGLWEGMTSSHWSFDDPNAALHVGYWRPLSVLALGLGNWLTNGDPAGFHLVSLVVHLFASLAAWRLAHGITGRLVPSWFAALLFAVHPVQVESVAWCSAINDPLAGLFGLLAIDAWLRWRRRGSRGIALAAPLWLAAALASKEQALAIPLVLILVDVVREWRAPDAAPRTGDQRLRDFAPVLVVLALYWGVRAWIFGDFAAGFDRLNAEYPVGAGRLAAMRVELFGGFVALLAWPAKLAVFRGIHPVPPDGDASLVIGGALAALWILALVVSWRRRAALVFGSLAAIPLLLGPVLAQPEGAGSYPLSDRYLYLPVLAFALLVVRGVGALAPRRVGPIVLGALGLIFGWRSVTHAAVFANEETFFRAAVDASPRVPAVHWGLGRVMLERYKLEHEVDQLEEAFLHFLASLSLGTDYGDRGPQLGPDAPIHDRLTEMERVFTQVDPTTLKPDPTVFVEAWDRLQANLGQGWCYLLRAQRSDEHDLDPALIVFRETARVFPESHSAHTGLGVALMQADRLEEAETELSRAVQLNPRNPEAWHNLAQVHRRTGKWAAARRAFERALFLRATNVGDLVGIATCAMEEGELEIARKRLEQARGEFPESLEAIFWSGVLSAREREYDAALGWFDEVLAREEGFGLAHLERGKVLLMQGLSEEAVQALGRACELLPTNFEAHYNLGSLLLGAGDGRSAKPYLIQAYALSERDELRDRLHMALVDIVAGEPDTAMQLARTAARNLDWEAALDWVDRTIDQHARIALDPNANYLRGDYLRQLERHEEAAGAYARALELDPEHFWATHNLAIVLAVDLRRYPEARTALRRALELLPEAPLEDEQLRETVRQRLQSLLGGVDKALAESETGG